MLGLKPGLESLELTLLKYNLKLNSTALWIIQWKNSSGTSSVAPGVGHFLLFPAPHGGGFVTFCTPPISRGGVGRGLLWLVHNLFTAQLCISQLKPSSPGHSGEFNIYPVLKVGPSPRAQEPRSLLKARIVGASEHRNQMKTIQIGIVRLGHVAKVKLYLRFYH